MYCYDQTSGLLSKDGVGISIGYSGFGVGKNNGLYQAIPNVGPIPRGLWDIGTPYNSDTHGPVCLPLTPRHDACGRTSFIIHGNGTHNPGEASRGCICIDRTARELIAVGEDHQLMVV